MIKDKFDIFHEKLCSFITEEKIPVEERFDIFHDIQRNHGMDVDGDWVTIGRYHYWIASWGKYELEVSDRLTEEKFMKWSRLSAGAYIAGEKEIEDLDKKMDEILKKYELKEE